MHHKTMRFISLGGGQSVGASCYYLKFGRANILLDCGSGRKKGTRFLPEFYTLLRTGSIQSYGEIGQIFLSHAHLDHCGALLDFLAEAPNAAVYATDLTRRLAGFQLRMDHQRRRRYGDIGYGYSDAWQENIADVSFGQKIPFYSGRDGYTAEFFAAGHIPGAMMTLLSWQGRKILYTGDYSLEPTLLTEGCALPQEVDVMIICGLHARHRNRGRKNLIGEVIDDLQRLIACGKSICCPVRELSKGVELLRMINTYLPGVPVYVSADIMSVVHEFESLAIPVMTIDDHPLSQRRYIRGQHITITTTEDYGVGEIVRNLQFSLHDDFGQTARFIKRINPSLCIVVHSPPTKDYEQNDETVEQYLMKDPDCRTQFIFAEDNEVYQI